MYITVSLRNGRRTRCGLQILGVGRYSAKILQLKREEQGLRIVGGGREQKLARSNFDRCAHRQALDRGGRNNGSQRTRSGPGLCNKRLDVTARLREIELELARAQDLEGERDLVAGGERGGLALERVVHGALQVSVRAGGHCAGRGGDDVVALRVARALRHALLRGRVVRGAAVAQHHREVHGGRAGAAAAHGCGGAGGAAGRAQLRIADGAGGARVARVSVLSLAGSGVRLRFDWRGAGCLKGGFVAGGNNVVGGAPVEEWVGCEKIEKSGISQSMQNLILGLLDVPLTSRPIMTADEADWLVCCPPAAL